MGTPLERFNMKLNILDRVSLMMLMKEAFPFSSYAGGKELRRTSEQLAFRSDEVEKFNIKIEPDGSVSFDREEGSNYHIEVALGEWITNKIRIVLIERDKDEKLTQEQLGLFEKFVIDYRTL